MKNEYKGMSLFNDVDDLDLRNRNRAVVMANIAEANMYGKKINLKGTSTILNYFHLVPINERGDVQKRFEENMRQRGFAT